MTKRLLVSYLAVTVVVLLLLEIPLALFYSQREIDRLSAGVERDASVLASIYEDDLEAGVTLDPQPAETYAARTGARVVVVDGRGISLVDTEQPAQRDLSTRPEIITALDGRRASGRRPSETLGTDLLYVALPVTSGGDIHGALRVTLDTAHVDSHVGRFWVGLVAIAVIVLLLMSLVGWVVARSVTRPIRRLDEAAARFAHGDLAASTDVGGGPPELRRLADTMGTMAQRLDAMLEEQRSFVADASHQLRTPLTAMRLRMENLQARLADGVGGEVEIAEVESAIDEITRLSSLVADLLQLARADRHAIAVTHDLARLATERVDTWGALAELQGVALVVAGAEAPVEVLAGPGAIEQILDNALDNALKVSPAGGTVTVTVVRGEREHRLEIDDQGPGLDDADKERALRRFWRRDATTPGTGLGLPIAHSLAAGSGGSLTLRDAPSGGLRVVLALPAAVSSTLPA